MLASYHPLLHVTICFCQRYIRREVSAESLPIHLWNLGHSNFAWYGWLGFLPALLKNCQGKRGAGWHEVASGVCALAGRASGADGPHAPSPGDHCVLSGRSDHHLDQWIALRDDGVGDQKRWLDDRPHRLYDARASRHDGKKGLLYRRAAAEQRSVRVLCGSVRQSGTL